MKTNYYQLDGLRGIAILMTIFTHASFGMMGVLSITPLFQQSKNEIILPDYIRHIGDQSGHGVQLFFIISAISLVFSLSSNTSFHLKHYLTKRFFRIAPAFYIGIIYYLAILGFKSRQFAPNGISASDILVTLSFFHIWSSKAYNAVVPGGWSISNEVMFYVLLPTMLCIIKKSRISFILLTIVSYAYAQLNYIWISNNAQWSAFQYFNFTNQLPVFMTGLLLGHTLFNLNITKFKSPFILIKYSKSLSIIFILFAILALPQFNIDRTLQSHLAFTIIACLSIYFIFINPSILFTNKILVHIGKVSFSIYLAHFSLMRICHQLASILIHTHGITFLLAYFLLLFTLSYLIAIVTYRIIELPFIKFSQKITSSTAAQ
ncbi:acyltransferase family protein [Aquitalea aquatica]|uniref:Acyltransferase n=1 Tax=Aquitalea aquatica TaxID=3044273 RepID=A0A838XZE5_9NEIS|nr:acyltransferase [Aquitalea magnusonii]MBA4708153.1 acyltransferase [Aquitalea magnusonii]